jgi:hypothetical protein
MGFYSWSEGGEQMGEQLKKMPRRAGHLHLSLGFYDVVASQGTLPWVFFRRTLLSLADIRLGLVLLTQ